MAKIHRASGGGTRYERQKKKRGPQHRRLVGNQQKGRDPAKREEKNTARIKRRLHNKKDGGTTTKSIHWSTRNARAAAAGPTNEELAKWTREGLQRKETMEGREREEGTL